MKSALCSRTTLLAIVMAVALAIMWVEVARAQVTGNLTVGGGYLAHPIGVQEETDATYLYQVLNLATVLGSRASTFKLGYEGQATQFGSDTQLGSQRHGLGVEWFHGSKDGRFRLSAGAQAAVRRQDDYYAAYDHDDMFAYLAFKKFTGSRTLIKGFAGYRARTYDELPEESSAEPHAQLEVMRFSDNNSSLGLRVRYGHKEYTDDIAPQVWGISNSPSTSQLAARLSFSRSLSPRTGLRAWAENRWKLSEFPHVIADDFYDSPILDRYAAEGFDLFTAVKTLLPSQWWLEVGGNLGEHDYGEILFVTAEGDGVSRKDTVVSGYLSVQRTLPKSLGQPRLNLMAGWRDQSSTHDWYTYSGSFASGNLFWKF